MENYSIIKAYYDSEEPYPVPFEEFWVWCGYSTKGNAKKVLEVNFTQNTDYQVFMQIDKNPKGGRPSEEIHLTIDCAKSFAMLAQTEKGKEVRNYFLQCEKNLQALSKPKTAIEILEMEIKIAIDHERRLKGVENRQNQVEARQNELEAKITSIDTNYYTVAGYYALHKRSIDITNAIKVGHEAVKISKELGVEIGKAYDAKFGNVNTYHQAILRAVLGF